MTSQNPSPQLVAALFVSRKGPYWGRPDVDAWDEQRDARLYAGPYPVVAHPPCTRWCCLAMLVEKRWGHKAGEDGGLFESALTSVRKWGGVLEQPAFSAAWAKYGLPRPPSFGWVRGAGGWTCQISQARYGHRARKLTWLYYVGPEPPELLRGKLKGSGWIAHCRRRGDGSVTSNTGVRLSKTEASRTPPAFAEALLSLARRSR